MPKENRLLTDEDVTAIVEELKAQLLKDFQLEVARGVLGWVKKVVLVVLLYLALQGVLGDKRFMETLTMLTPPNPKA